MAMLHLTLKSLDDMACLAADLADVLPRGTVICLNGDLGAGKTTFAQYFIRALARDLDLIVTSPTFNLATSYETPAGPVWHYDLYRVTGTSELNELGFDEAFAARAVLVEWPDRAENGFWPKARTINITLTRHDDETRQVKIDFGAVIDMPDTAFVFAAGLGTRMKPFTEHAPKTMVPVLGRPVLGYLFDDLADVGVKRLVLNTHHFSEQVQAFCESECARFKIQVSHEDEILETGGGLKRALPMMGRDVFYALNGDCPLTNAPGLTYLARLAAAFNPSDMDILLLLQPNDDRMITPFVGDYHFGGDGRLTRALDQKGTHMFTGVRILHRRCIETAPNGRYTFRDNMDVAQKQGRLFGLVHRGEWHHLSTLEDVRRVENFWQHKT